MRKRLTWLLVSLGIAALLRRLRRRGETDDALPGQAPSEDGPADELRRKLADTRADEADTPEAPLEETVEERRADVHEQGRSALDDMRDSEKD